MTLEHTRPAVLAVLLDAWADQQPAPQIPRWQRDSERGLTAGEWRTCPTCHGDGTQKRRNHQVTCPACKGHCGWLTDAYSTSGERVAPNSDGISEMSLLAFYNTAQAVADHSGAPGIERIERLFDRRLDSTLTDRARSIHPCFQQLEHALIGMRAVAPHHRAVLVCVHLLGLPLNGDMALYDDALLILGDVLGDGFRAPRWAREKADQQLKAQRAAKAVASQHAQKWPDREARATEARRLAEQGRSVRWIAQQLGVSKSVIGRDLAT